MTNVITIERLTKADIQHLLNRFHSKKQIFESLGVYFDDTRAKKLFNEKLKSFNLEHKLRSKRRGYDDKQFELAVKTSLCISQVLDKLGLVKHGGNFASIRKQVDQLKLDISHFDPHSVRLQSAKLNTWDVKTIFCKDSKCPRGMLRRFVLRHKALPVYECEQCSNSGLWNYKTLNLTIDHKNGTHNDNRINNIRWLCPNCHSQTETFGPKNRRMRM